MQRRSDGQLLFSASDLVNFLGCEHATTLDLGNLDRPQSFGQVDEETQLLQRLGIEHELAYLELLKGEGKTVAEIPADLDLAERVERTLQAMRAGVEVIYQGALIDGSWHGYSDFLLKVDGVKSRLGSYAYEVADTKLARTAKPKHIIQLCVYADLLAAVQGIDPPNLHVVLGGGSVATVSTANVRHYYATARERFQDFAIKGERNTSAEPCRHCTFCRWAPTCEAHWSEIDHLSQVANISRSQIVKLHASGIETLADMATAGVGTDVPDLNPAQFHKLRSQAALQFAKRTTGDNAHEILPSDPPRGFDRIPRTNEGDIFFDMEGDPHQEGGLEYLFGIVVIDGGRSDFKPFWGHDRAGEKLAFEACVDFMTDRLRRFPAAHIYHYGSYEETALKRLAMIHGTRENVVDDLLRHEKLVDLFQAVREAIRVSEPRYSIKNLEVFYRAGKREGEVTTAGASIVMYERWRRTQEQQILDDIATYNEDDCVSTWECRNWLLTLRPDGASWFAGPAAITPTPEKVAKRTEAIERIETLYRRLVEESPEQDRAWRSLLADLLEFHRREAKPGYWAMFTRQWLSDEELLDDAECLAGLQPDPNIGPYADKRSTLFSFRFPPQDFKLWLGDKPLRAGSLEPAGEIVALDELAGTVALKLGPSRSPLPDPVSLIPEGPLDDLILRGAIQRLAEAVLAGDADRYRAVIDILARQPTRLAGMQVVPDLRSLGETTLDATIGALSRLDRSIFLLQGPPGSGKTYTASHAILALLRTGKRIGVASNSHKAINKVLEDVEALACEEGFRLRGIKKSSREEQYLNGAGMIADTTDNNAVTQAHQLIAGTAWLFARDTLDQSLDYLFVDEAGQVSLANLVAMGLSSRNIVLIGDQMQLSQPIQGTHPGQSGLSGLDHLMEGHATVPGDRGIFLEVTRRMNREVCGFISAAVYDGRLAPHPTTHDQQLILSRAGHGLGLPTAGISFVEASHQACAQRSTEEAALIIERYNALLGCHWVDQSGETRPITTADILVVSPYNMQVDLLRGMLPPGARVGTVDKFQGQEAAVVMISMATSSGEDLPRNIEFLYSRNRLNVAISRARCLAVLIANPRLLEIPCGSLVQMELVNGLCWARSYARSRN